LGEVIASVLLMGSGIKGKETLQLNFAGTSDLRNAMAITDSGNIIDLSLSLFLSFSLFYLILIK
jgi:hypothetical protein